MLAYILWLTLSGRLNHERMIYETRGGHETHSIFIGKPYAKRPVGRFWRVREDNIKIDFGGKRYGLDSTVSYCCELYALLSLVTP